MASHILFVDNDEDFLNTRAEFLIREGYEVFKAISLSEAYRFLENENIHLVVVDIRMENDDDERDLSGLKLVIDEEYRLIPKIILTGHPNTDTARISLKLQSSGAALAFDYVKKSDSTQDFVQSVKEILVHHSQINWSLSIDWKICDPLYLVKVMDPQLEGKLLIHRAEEIEDLFRRLYTEKDQIRVEKMLWDRVGRLALVILAFKEGVNPEACIVVCGHAAIISEEAKSFRKYSPNVSGAAGTNISGRTAVTTHYAANAYILAGHVLEGVQTLFDFYKYGPEKVFNIGLKYLFQDTLKAWHQEKFIQIESGQTGVSYCDRLNLTGLAPFYFEERLRMVEVQIPKLNVSITKEANMLSVGFSHSSYKYPNPTSLLKRLMTEENPELYIVAPGTISGDSIVVDQTGKAWLTDFFETGLTPVFWNYISLEAQIRFDWVETKDLLRRYELEKSLTFTDFAKPDIRGLEPILRKPAKAIHNIRGIAANVVGKNTIAYQQGIFLQAARRLADFNPALPLTTSELARLGQILLSMSMIASLFDTIGSDKIGDHKQSNHIQIADEKARIVEVGNRKERLTPQTFILFSYLFHRGNQICSKDELLNEVLQGKYEEGYLHTLIGRIRKVIEEDPDRPRYLITEPNAGYKLITPVK